MPPDEIAKAITDTVKVGTKIVESLVKEFWPILDAATEKKTPSQYLSDNATKAVQGFKPE